VQDSNTTDTNFVPPITIGKWTVKIIDLLKEKPYRHSELRRQLAGASQRMLTKTLRNLESAGLVERRVRQEKPLAVEYSLTKLGRTFLVPLKGVCRWAKRHQRELKRCHAYFETS
jgi:DNA-binding HxlR family transcriptional regulator